LHQTKKRRQAGRACPYQLADVPCHRRFTPGARAPTHLTQFLNHKFIFTKIIQSNAHKIRNIHTSSNSFNSYQIHNHNLYNNSILETRLKKIHELTHLSVVPPPRRATHRRAPPCASRAAAPLRTAPALLLWAPRPPPHHVPGGPLPHRATPPGHAPSRASVCQSGRCLVAHHAGVVPLGAAPPAPPRAGRAAAPSRVAQALCLWAPRPPPLRAAPRAYVRRPCRQPVAKALRAPPDPTPPRRRLLLAPGSRLTCTRRGRR
jgi:hypothetical protein